MSPGPLGARGQAGPPPVPLTACPAFQILVQVKEVLSKLSTLVETTLKEVRAGGRCGWARWGSLAGEGPRSSETHRPTWLGLPSLSFHPVSVSLDVPLLLASRSLSHPLHVCVLCLCLCMVLLGLP